MRFPPQFLDELRARLPVSEVVGKRVKLRKAGREWRGLSPFNKERTPSFFVNDQKGFYHDFSSGKHGDIFNFVMEAEGITFPEAVERLAGLAGLEAPKLSREDDVAQSRRRTLHEVMELAAKFFEAALAGRGGARARGYLADRGLDPATQLRFRIGYAAPDRFALKEHLGGLGIAVEDMVEAGLLVAGDEIPVPYDRFRNRVMFPIDDLTGRVVAFGGRTLDDAPAKYLNSPETPLFHKGAMLYNAAAARKAAHQGARVIAVEGYVDVIAMVTAGYGAAVAPLGTALTPDQMALLWKMADEPVLCFDGDGAGQRAAFRAIDVALPLIRPGKSLLFASLPQGHDPDDLVRSGATATLADVLAAARPLGEVLWAREFQASPSDTPERRAGLEARLNELTATITDEAVRRYYRQDLGQRLRDLARPAPRHRPATGFPGRDSRGGHGKGGRGGPGARFAERPESLATVSPRMSTSAIVRGARATLPPREALIMLGACNHPWLIESGSEELAELEFVNQDINLLRRAILDVAAGDERLAKESLHAALVARGFEPVLQRIEGATHPANWPARDGAAEDVRQWWTHVITLHRKNRTLNKELKEAERALGEELSERNFAWLQDVRGQLQALDGTEASIEGFGDLSGRRGRGL